MTKEVVLVGACRTPVASFGGALKDINVTDLGSIVMSEAIKRAGIKAEILDEVIFGCVLQAA
ncbi:MAG TPA: acetyl-CoA C-acyltransferase, partial [Syntrophomonas sp.]|nr:acetyl-CoA C-acyltransferase [Syntrophomonas sp.]